MRLFNVIAAVYGLYGVVFGAVAAHAIADAHGAEMVKTAALYALVHAVVLLCWQGEGHTAYAAKALMALGVLFFSGAITAKYMLSMVFVGGLAPFGGMMLILGWVFVLLTVVGRVK